MAAAKPRLKKIAISTGGGDAPGLNAVIRAVVLSRPPSGLGSASASATATTACWMPGSTPSGGLVPLTPGRRGRGITHLGGTILGTTNRGNPAQVPGQAARRPGRASVDRSDELVARLHARAASTR